MTEYSYSIEKYDSNIQLKVSNHQMELNLTMKENESIELIENIQKTDWNKRKSIKAGICLNSSVFWCINEGKSLSLLIGHDDETWQIGLIVSIEVIDKIKSEIGYNKV